MCDGWGSYSSTSSSALSGPVSCTICTALIARIMSESPCRGRADGERPLCPLRPGTVEARQAVVGNRLPRRRRADPLTVFGANPRIGVQRAQAHMDVLVRVAAGTAEEMTAALDAVPLRLPAIGLPEAQQPLTLLDRKCARGHARVGRARGARSPLAV